MQDILLFLRKNKKRFGNTQSAQRRRTRRKKTSSEDSYYAQFRSVAEKMIKERTEEIAHEYGFTYNRIVIKNTKTRWGSCSSKGNINLHYKLMFLPPELRDYVIVHELCHLREMNHSIWFWKEVENIIPGYKKLAQSMRKLHPDKVIPPVGLNEQG